MKQPRQNKALKYFISSILLLLLLAFYNGEFSSTEQPTTLDPSNMSFNTGMTVQVAEPNLINLPQNRIDHILYGDHSGGGHKFGTGKPCKSEFPKNWDAQKIIKTIQKIAANDNVKWELQSNGYFVANSEVEKLKIRVVIDMDKDEVVTAYPTNVPRNPCPPRPANDNSYNR